MSLKITKDTNAAHYITNQWLLSQYSKVDTKVMSPIFFSESIGTIILKFTFILSKVEIIFPWSIQHCQHTFSTLRWIALYWSSRTTHWSVRALHACCISSHHCP